MRSISLLFLFVLLCSSCEDVIEVEVNNTTPRLTIDAYFNLYTYETPLRLEGGVRLSMSADYFDTTIPVITEAQVSVTHLESGLEYPLTYNPETTFFVPENPIVLTDLNSDYLLRVIHDGDTYESTTQFIPVSPIESVTQGTKTLFSGDETEVIVTFKDNPTREDYYLYDFGLDIYRPIEDRFFQGESFVFSNFYSSDEVRVGETITVKAHGIEKQYFSYFELILGLSDGGGGPFESIPSSARGNIVNTTDPEQYPLGYFLLSESDAVSLLVRDLPKD